MQMWMSNTDILIIGCNQTVENRLPCGPHVDTGGCQLVALYACAGHKILKGDTSHEQTCTWKPCENPARA